VEPSGSGGADNPGMTRTNFTFTGTAAEHAPHRKKNSKEVDYGKNGDFCTIGGKKG
jgi:hypothetical protein